MRVIQILAITTVGFLKVAGLAHAEETCSYSTWAWNAERQRAEAFEDIVKPRSDLVTEERHMSLPCSICREDQEEIALEGLEPFLVCRHVAADIRYALTNAIAAGFPIDTVIGYRVGRTKGDLNDKGQRTRYSYHSFGLAVDINPGKNGLYDQCVEISPSCRLRRGGPWRPGAQGAITPSSAVYHEITGIGWRWGGELPGRQKDMMHFSPTGD